MRVNSQWNSSSWAGVGSPSLAPINSRWEVFLKEILWFKQESVQGRSRACAIQIRLDDHNDPSCLRIHESRGVEDSKDDAFADSLQESAVGCGQITTLLSPPERESSRREEGWPQEYGVKGCWVRPA